MTVISFLTEVRQSRSAAGSVCFSVRVACWTLWNIIFYARVGKDLEEICYAAVAGGAYHIS